MAGEIGSVASEVAVKEYNNYQALFLNSLPKFVDIDALSTELQQRLKNFEESQKELLRKKQILTDELTKGKNEINELMTAINEYIRTAEYIRKKVHNLFKNVDVLSIPHPLYQQLEKLYYSLGNLSDIPSEEDHKEIENQCETISNALQDHLEKEKTNDNSLENEEKTRRETLKDKLYWLKLNWKHFNEIDETLDDELESEITNLYKEARNEKQTTQERIYVIEQLQHKISKYGNLSNVKKEKSDYSLIIRKIHQTIIFIEMYHNEVNDYFIEELAENDNFAKQITDKLEQLNDIKKEYLEILRTEDIYPSEEYINKTQSTLYEVICNLYEFLQEKNDEKQINSIQSSLSTVRKNLGENDELSIPTSYELYKLKLNSEQEEQEEQEEDIKQNQQKLKNDTDQLFESIDKFLDEGLNKFKEDIKQLEKCIYELNELTKSEKKDLDKIIKTYVQLSELIKNYDQNHIAVFFSKVNALKNLFPNDYRVKNALNELTNFNKQFLAIAKDFFEKMMPLINENILNKLEEDTKLLDQHIDTASVLLSQNKQDNNGRIRDISDKTHQLISSYDENYNKFKSTLVNLKLHFPSETESKRVLYTVQQKLTNSWERFLETKLKTNELKKDQTKSIEEDLKQLNEYSLKVNYLINELEQIAPKPMLNKQAIEYISEINTKIEELNKQFDLIKEKTTTKLQLSKIFFQNDNDFNNLQNTLDNLEKPSLKTSTWKEQFKNYTNVSIENDLNQLQKITEVIKQISGDIASKAETKLINEYSIGALDEQYKKIVNQCEYNFYRLTLFSNTDQNQLNDFTNRLLEIQSQKQKAEEMAIESIKKDLHNLDNIRNNRNTDFIYNYEQILEQCKNKLYKFKILFPNNRFLTQQQNELDTLELIVANEDNELLRSNKGVLKTNDNSNQPSLFEQLQFNSSSNLIPEDSDNLMENTHDKNKSPDNTSGFNVTPLEQNTEFKNSHTSELTKNLIWEVKESGGQTQNITDKITKSNDSPTLLKEPPEFDVNEHLINDPTNLSSENVLAKASSTQPSQEETYTPESTENSPNTDPKRTRNTKESDNKNDHHEYKSHLNVTSLQNDTVLNTNTENYEHLIKSEDIDSSNSISSTTENSTQDTNTEHTSNTQESDSKNEPPENNSFTPLKKDTVLNTNPENYEHLKKSGGIDSSNSISSTNEIIENQTTLPSEVKNSSAVKLQLEQENILEEDCNEIMNLVSSISNDVLNYSEDISLRFNNPEDTTFNLEELQEHRTDVQETNAPEFTKNSTPDIHSERTRNPLGNDKKDKELITNKETPEQKNQFTDLEKQFSNLTSQTQEIEKNANNALTINNALIEIKSNLEKLNSSKKMIEEWSAYVENEGQEEDVKFINKYYKELHDQCQNNLNHFNILFPGNDSQKELEKEFLKINSQKQEVEQNAMQSIKKDLEQLKSISESIWNFVQDVKKSDGKEKINTNEIAKSNDNYKQIMLQCGNKLKRFNLLFPDNKSLKEDEESISVICQFKNQQEINATDIINEDFKNLYSCQQKIDTLTNELNEIDSKYVDMLSHEFESFFDKCHHKLEAFKVLFSDSESVKKQKEILNELDLLFSNKIQILREKINEKQTPVSNDRPTLFQELFNVLAKDSSTQQESDNKNEPPENISQLNFTHLQKDKELNTNTEKSEPLPSDIKSEEIDSSTSTSSTNETMENQTTLSSEVKSNPELPNTQENVHHLDVTPMEQENIPILDGYYKDIFNQYQKKLTQFNNSQNLNQVKDEFLDIDSQKKEIENIAKNSIENDLFRLTEINKLINESIKENDNHTKIDNLNDQYNEISLQYKKKLKWFKKLLSQEDNSKYEQRFLEIDKTKSEQPVLPNDFISITKLFDRHDNKAQINDPTISSETVFKNNSIHPSQLETTPNLEELQDGSQVQGTNAPGVTENSTQDTNTEHTSNTQESDSKNEPPENNSFTPLQNDTVLNTNTENYEHLIKSEDIDSSNSISSTNKIIENQTTLPSEVKTSPELSNNTQKNVNHLDVTPVELEDSSNLMDSTHDINVRQENHQRLNKLNYFFNQIFPLVRKGRFSEQLLNDIEKISAVKLKLEQENILEEDCNEIMNLVSSISNDVLNDSEDISASEKSFNLYSNLHYFFEKTFPPIKEKQFSKEFLNNISTLKDAKSKLDNKQNLSKNEIAQMYLLLNSVSDEILGLNAKKDNNPEDTTFNLEELQEHRTDVQETNAPELTENSTPDIHSERTRNPLGNDKKDEPSEGISQLNVKSLQKDKELITNNETPKQRKKDVADISVDKDPNSSLVKKNRNNNSSTSKTENDTRKKNDSNSHSPTLSSPNTEAHASATQIDLERIVKDIIANLNNRRGFFDSSPEDKIQKIQDAYNILKDDKQGMQLLNEGNFNEIKKANNIAIKDFLDALKESRSFFHLGKVQSYQEFKSIIESMNGLEKIVNQITTRLADKRASFFNNSAAVKAEKITKAFHELKKSEIDVSELHKVLEDIKNIPKNTTPKVKAFINALNESRSLLNLGDVKSFQEFKFKMNALKTYVKDADESNEFTPTKK